jgi:hypothetical protein
MLLKAGPWDGAQSRNHVLKVLREHGVSVEKIEEDWYELEDLDGDAEVLRIPAPVLSETVAYLYRRYGELHGFEITDLRNPRKPRPS